MNIETFLNNLTCVNSMSDIIKNLEDYIQLIKGDNVNV